MVGWYTSCRKIPAVELAIAAAAVVLAFFALRWFVARREAARREQEAQRRAPEIARLKADARAFIEEYRRGYEQRQAGRR